VRFGSFDGVVISFLVITYRFFLGSEKAGMLPFRLGGWGWLLHPLYISHNLWECAVLYFRNFQTARGDMSLSLLYYQNKTEGSFDMSYRPKALDPDKIEEMLENNRIHQRNKKLAEGAKVDAFYRGYEAAIEDMKGTLNCSNYELPLTSSSSESGLHAFYLLCKELDVESQDIRESVLSLDEMVATLADRIKKRLKVKRSNKQEWPLKGEAEVRNILAKDGIYYQETTVSAFKDSHFELRDYSVDQLGKVLNRLGIEQRKIYKIVDGKRTSTRVRRLPLWKPAQ